jgi:hypothetical protein
MTIVMRYVMAILAVSLLMFQHSVSLAAEPATTAPASAPAREVDPAITAFMTQIDADKQDDALRQKLKERHNTAAELLKLHIDRYRSGVADASSVFETAREVADAKMSLARTPAEREAVARQVLEVTRSVEARLEKQVKSGLGLELNLMRAKLARERAEIELLTLQQAAAAATTAPTTRPG